MENIKIGDSMERVIGEHLGMTRGCIGTVSRIYQSQVEFKEYKGLHSIKFCRKIEPIISSGCYLDRFNTDEFDNRDIFSGYKVVNFLSAPKQSRWSKPNIININDLASKKLLYYMQSTTDEISGMGMVEKKETDKTTIFTIEDIFLFKQISTSANTVLDKENVAKLQYEIVKKGLDWNKFRLWWHSHGNNEPFWSAVDDGNCDDFAKLNKDADYMVSVVGNTNFSLLGRVDVYKPKRKYDLKIKPVLLALEDPILRKVCEEEAKEKNKVKKFYGKKYNVRETIGNFQSLYVPYDEI